MKTNNGPSVHYELVYRLFPVDVFSLQGKFYKHIGKQRGILVKSNSMGRTWYHPANEMLEWKCDKVKP